LYHTSIALRLLHLTGFPELGSHSRPTAGKLIIVRVIYNTLLNDNYVLYSAVLRQVWIIVHDTDSMPILLIVYGFWSLSSGCKSEL